MVKVKGGGCIESRRVKADLTTIKRTLAFMRPYRLRNPRGLTFLVLRIYLITTNPFLRTFA